MAKVTVYRFRVYDVTNDEMKQSTRWGTAERIKEISGQICLDTATEVDESEVNSDIPGLTKRGWPGPQRPGFQTRVKDNPWDP
jgi:hypothetical protein